MYTVKCFLDMEQHMLPLHLSRKHRLIRIYCVCHSLNKGLKDANMVSPKPLSEGQTLQWPEESKAKSKDLQNTTQITKEWELLTTLKTGSKLNCYVRISRSSSTSGSRSFTAKTIQTSFDMPIVLNNSIHEYIQIK